MDKKLVAVFDNQDEARQALAALIDAGFSSSKARLASAGSSDAARPAVRPDKEESLGDKIASFFGFGDDDEVYSEAVRRGSCVLTVDAGSDDECDRAKDIIDDFDPVDMDTREAEWRESGWQAPARTGRDATLSDADETIPDLDERSGGGAQGSRVRVIPVTGRPAGETTPSGGQRTDPGARRYDGPERRVRADASYRGIERRAAL